MMEPRYFKWLHRVPKNSLSQWVGAAMGLKMPGPLSRLMIKSFAEMYNISIEDAEKPLSEYQSIGEFFTRRLKPGLRPIQGSVVHPADAELTQVGYAADGILIQAKGHSYSVEALVGDRDLGEKLHGGLYLTYYLCPTDYHRVHSPVSGKVVQSVLIPGTLWPVNEFSVKHVPQLFAVNERLVTVIDSPDYGLVALVMVGATNVGKMTVTYDSTLSTNLGSKRIETKTHNTPIEAGDELGTFHMGSTVILVFQADRLILDPKKLKGVTRVGQRLEEKS